MSVYGISKEKLKSLSYNDETSILTISWETGGMEKAVCGLKLKVELVEKIVSTYKSPNIPYDPDYNNPF